MANPPAQLQLAVLMFTDIVNSVSLQKKLGTAAYTSYITRHDEIFKACLAQVPGARILNETGDGFLVRLNSSSDAVNTALRLQYRFHTEICEGEPMAVRIGLHSGEITEMQEGLRGETRAVGMAINLAARIMDLAAEGQILMTRAVFDDARQFTRNYPEIDGIDSAALPPLLWPAFGRYLFKGNDEPMEIYGVGAEGITPLMRPEGSEKAKRAVAADEEATLGWRPGAGLAIPRREDWVIDRKIGEGGFGEVWLAENKKSRMERVFKFCFDPDRLRSFKRELTLFRLLRDALGNRRDIAALYEVSVEAPPYYLESEYVPTGNISQWFESQGGIGNVPLATRLQIMAKAARAASAAHSVGIIHKDIKPSNILISEENGIPEPRLSDFGIGTLADTSRLGSMGITSNGFTESVILESDGSQSFTHLYAPPEYLVGKPASVRGDIYSLGVMLYQVAVGDLNSPLATGWRRGIKDDLLADDIRRCVDVDPERRFQSASHLAEHLEQLDDRHAEKEEEQRVERLKQNAIRRKRITMVTVSVACGLALMTGLLAKGYLDQRMAKREADEQRQQAEQATKELLTQAGRSDFLLASQLLTRDQRSEALAYLAQAVRRDPHYLNAGRKLMATLAMSRFLPLRLPPIQTLTRSAGQPFAVDVSPDGTQLVAMAAAGENGEEELRVWDLSGANRSHEKLHWEAGASSERILDVAFASDQLICFITRANDRSATLHTWEKTPQWAWVRSTPLERIDGYSGFLANAAFWVWERRLGRPDARRRGPPRSELAFQHLATGAITTVPAPPGQLITLEGHVVDGALEAMVAVHEIGPDARALSGWASLPTTQPTDPLNPPDNNDENDDDRSWQTFSRGNSWSGPPLNIALSSDGRCAAIPEPDGSVKIWSLENVGGQTGHLPIMVIQKPNDLVTGVEFSPDSRKLAVGYFGSSAIVYDVASGSKLIGPLQHEGGVMGLDFRGDGALLLTRSLDQTARLWDASTGKALSEPMMHDSYVVRGEISADGKSAITVGYDGIAKVWNLEGGSAEGENLPPQDGHRFSTISPDWKTLFTSAEVRSNTGGAAEYAGYFNSRQRVTTSQPLAAGARFSGSRFSSDGQSLIAVREDGSVTVRDVQSGSDAIFTLGENDQRIQLRAISGDGSTLAITALDRGPRPPKFLLSVWRRGSGNYETLSGIPNDQQNTLVALSHDGTRMVTSHGQELEVWELDANSGAYSGHTINRLSVTTALEMAPGGGRFIVGTAEGTLQLLNYDGTELTRPLKQSGPVVAIRLADDGSTAAVATASLESAETARVQVWDLDSKESLTPPMRFFGGGSSDNPWQQEISGASTQLAFSPDFSQLLLHYLGDTVIWSLVPSFESGAIPDIVPKLAEAVGGVALRAASDPKESMAVSTKVPYSQFSKLSANRSLSDAALPPSDVQRWLFWLLSSPENRPIAPTSDMANEAFTDYLIKQNSLATLYEAVLRNPNDHRIQSIYFSQLMAEVERGGSSVASEEAAWFAEISTKFLKEETSRPQRRGPDSRTRYREVAKALSIIGKFRPDDPEQLEYYRNSLKNTFAPALEARPDDLSLWFATGMALQRIGLLLDESSKADSYSHAALVVFALLAEQGQRDASRQLGEVAKSIENGDQPERRDARTRREERGLLSDFPSIRLTAAISAVNDLPPWLKRAFEFYCGITPTPAPPTDSPTLWMHRAFVQSSLGNHSEALTAANHALEFNGVAPFAELKLQRLRARLLVAQGDFVGAQEAFSIAHGIPSRPPAASTRMIDLSPFFSAGLQRTPHPSSHDSRNTEPPSFAIAPGILKSLQGIAFDARGIVFPSRESGAEATESVAAPIGIAVNQTAEQLHFLHSAIIPGRDDAEGVTTTIGNYQIHFDDGTSDVVPIRAGIEVSDWNHPTRTSETNPPATPMIAWTGFSGDSVDSGAATLFLTTWQNPRPEVIIESIDFVDPTRQRAGLPFLIAITAQ